MVFPVAFAKYPSVSAIVYSPNPDNYSISVKSSTRTGMTVVVKSAAINAIGLYVDWIVVER